MLARNKLVCRETRRQTGPCPLLPAAPTTPPRTVVRPACRPCCREGSQGPRWQCRGVWGAPRGQGAPGGLRFPAVTPLTPGPARRVGCVGGGVQSPTSTDLRL